MTLIHLDDDYLIWRSFDFQNYWRNEILSIQKKIFFSIKKTGTTIAGIIFKEGLILASDTRATNEEISCDLNCEKIHYLAPNICCCGAGTSADTESVTKSVSNHLELQRLSTGRESRVQSSVSIIQRMLFQFNGLISAALIIGGYDFLGAHIYSIHPHGSTENLPFIAMGSGSLASTAILEKFFNNNMDINSAKNIIKEAVLAGIYNDIGSGGNVDFCIIKKKTLEFERNEKKQNFKKTSGYFFHKKDSIRIRI
mmetsp:Transcript_61251/g.126521  ORF Transcript_61251/g.126521 Transcript_61251/m.126521 type:complete len:254 (-) Transcript_61251:2128-2889(-)